MPTTSPSIRALLIAQHPAVLGATLPHLERWGLSVLQHDDGQRGLESALRDGPDVVLLESQLHAADGRSMCLALRERCDVPIVMVSADDDETERVLGLESGADDYVSVPCSSRELLARVRAHVRRARGQSGPATSLLELGRLTVDRMAQEARLDGQRLPLTSTEFALLRVLSESAGQVVTRDQLIARARQSDDEVFDRTIDVLVSRLRKKLGDDPRSPSLLKTVRGQGYLLVRSVTAVASAR